MEFSVLLSVYNRENHIFFKKAIDSIFLQTVIPTEIVLVKDGPLTNKLNNVIDNFKNKYKDRFNIVDIKNNVGLGKALAKGLENCNYNLVARMDADDIAKSNRFEKQIKLFENDPELCIVGSWVNEFENDISNVISTRKVPQHNKEIKEFAKSRNPFNHPSVMFKKESVLKAGSYLEFYLNEDYYLWLRMLNMGFKAYNIQESLLFFRISKDTFKRRGGLKYAKQDIKLQNELLKMEYINKYEYIKNILTRPITRLLPNFLREQIYKKLLR